MRAIDRDVGTLSHVCARATNGSADEGTDDDGETPNPDRARLVMVLGRTL